MVVSLSGILGVFLRSCLSFSMSRNIIYRDIYLVTYYYYINDSKSVIVRLIQTVESMLINRSKK